MRLTNTLLAAGAAAVLAGPALAGGFAPVAVEAAPVEPVVVVEPAPQRSTFGVLLPVLLLGGLVAAAVATDDDEGGAANRTVRAGGN